MGLLYLKEIRKEAKIGIWEIDEDPDYLLSKLILNRKEIEYITGLTNERRFMHWLGSRVLIKELLGTTGEVILEMDQYGKPKLQNYPHHLSISHSNEYACAIISESKNVAVDIEHVHPKIGRVAHKFMSRDELDRLDLDFELEEMFVYWCAKEVLYKIYGLKELNFKKHIFIDPFRYGEKGEVKGRISKGEFNREYVIYYEKLDEYLLAYTLD